ncbi:DNA replication complex GINS protein PSF1 [Ciona intestinalis]|uniref:DNA replication complex GINS protein PSF1 n=1 Tax=Ciona intestinalis TaxID=7719 RepID=H2XZ76_CIOIN|nr:DNA replication complex GINS protein PSF1 [Ciona intestinalis]|eukprot:XP_002131593.1 DNA replication complex GINS protein PSF1 [Ciona intestinalis]
MFGEKALDLIREVHRTREGSLGPYNEDGVRQVLEEMQVLYEANQQDVAQLVQNDSDQTSLTAVQIRHDSLQRNKRCLLAYLYNRLQKIRALRWEFGSVLPTDVRGNMSPKEIEWFTKYNRALANYMRSLGNGGLDLTQDLHPPQNVHIEVRCVEDKGELELDDGSKILLKKNSLHYLPRSQCEHLIRQGVLKHVT